MSRRPAFPRRRSALTRRGGVPYVPASPEHTRNELREQRLRRLGYQLVSREDRDENLWRTLLELECGA